MIRKRVCLNIIRLMDENDINATQLARMLDVSSAVVSRWVNFQNAPEYTAIDKMRDVLGWEAEDLFCDPQKPRSKSGASNPTPTNWLAITNALGLLIVALGFEKPNLKKKSDG